MSKTDSSAAGELFVSLADKETSTSASPELSLSPPVMGQRNSEWYYNTLLASRIPEDATSPDGSPSLSALASSDEPAVDAKTTGSSETEPEPARTTMTPRTHAKRLKKLVRRFGTDTPPLSERSENKQSFRYTASRYPIPVPKVTLTPLKATHVTLSRVLQARVNAVDEKSSVLSQEKCKFYEWPNHQEVKVERKLYADSPEKLAERRRSSNSKTSTTASQTPIAAVTLYERYTRAAQSVQQASASLLPPTASQQRTSSSTKSLQYDDHDYQLDNVPTIDPQSYIRLAATMDTGHIVTGRKRSRASDSIVRTSKRIQNEQGYRQSRSLFLQALGQLREQARDNQTKAPVTTSATATPTKKAPKVYIPGGKIADLLPLDNDS